MSAALEELAAHIELKRPNEVVATEVAFGELNVTVTLAGIEDFVEFLRADQNCRFSTLVDITAVDHPERPARFDVVYHFLSMYRNQRIRVKLAAREDDMVPSIATLHPSANWFEREVFDMFGILFSGHPDLRRILTDYGFRGHPLRKDFPTTGYTEVRYDEA
jgi:NADH-quinone oxidoreductase subunit C